MSCAHLRAVLHARPAPLCQRHYCSVSTTNRLIRVTTSAMLEHQDASPHWHAAPCCTQEQLEWEAVLSGKTLAQSEQTNGSLSSAPVRLGGVQDDWFSSPSPAFSHGAALPSEAAAWDQAMSQHSQHGLPCTSLPACAVVIGSHSVMSVVHDGQQEAVGGYQSAQGGSYHWCLAGCAWGS